MIANRLPDGVEGRTLDRGPTDAWHALARIRRDGHTRLVRAEELVPGDIVLVNVGDSISASLRLFEASNVIAWHRRFFRPETKGMDRHSFNLAGAP